MTYITTKQPREIDVITNSYHGIHIFIPYPSENSFTNDAIDKLSCPDFEVIYSLVKQWQAELNSPLYDYKLIEYYSGAIDLLLNRTFCMHGMLHFDMHYNNLRKCWEKVDSQLSYHWSVAEIAKLSNLSIVHLYRQMDIYYKMKPMEYLCKLRMDLAKLLLRENNHSIKEISERCGYANAYCFSNAFTRYFNIRPGAYRDQHENEYRRMLETGKL